MESDERRKGADPELGESAGESAETATGPAEASADGASGAALADGTETAAATTEEPRSEAAAGTEPPASEATDTRAGAGDGSTDTRREPKAPGPVPTEAEIDSPDRRTLLLFGVIFIVTAASWGSAKLACNYHPPQSRPPPELPTDQLARTPKDAAIEFVFRRSTRNYEGALDLATGELAKEIEREAATCDEQGAACINERARLEKTLLTRALVKSVEGEQAVTEVTSLRAGTEERFEVTLKKDGLVWKSTAQKKL